MKQLFAAMLVSGCTLHPGDTRGLASNLDDALIGTWHGVEPNGAIVGSPTNLVGFTKPLNGVGTFENRDSVLAINGTSWRRETPELITIADAATGPETVQTDFSDDESTVFLRWRTAEGIQSAELVRAPENQP